MHKEFQEDYQEGLLSEDRIASYLMRHILDEQDKAFLANNSLSIPIILNGRYDSFQFSETLKIMAQKWNNQLGFEVIYPKFL